LYSRSPHKRSGDWSPPHDLSADNHYRTPPAYNVQDVHRAQHEALKPQSNHSYSRIHPDPTFRYQDQTRSGQVIAEPTSPYPDQTRSGQVIAEPTSRYPNQTRLGQQTAPTIARNQRRRREYTKEERTGYVDYDSPRSNDVTPLYFVPASREQSRYPGEIIEKERGFGVRAESHYTSIIRPIPSEQLTSQAYSRQVPAGKQTTSINDWIIADEQQRNASNFSGQMAYGQRSNVNNSGEPLHSANGHGQRSGHMNGLDYREAYLVQGRHPSDVGYRLPVEPTRLEYRGGEPMNRYGQILPVETRQTVSSPPPRRSRMNLVTVGAEPVDNGFMLANRL